jgi:hypothetical protein
MNYRTSLYPSTASSTRPRTSWPSSRLETVARKVPVSPIARCRKCLEPLPKSKYLNDVGSCQNLDCIYKHRGQKKRNRERVVANLPPGHQGCEKLIEILARFRTSSGDYRLYENVLSPEDCEQVIEWLQRLESPNYSDRNFGQQKENDKKRQVDSSPSFNHLIHSIDSSANSGAQSLHLRWSPHHLVAWISPHGRKF